MPCKIYDRGETGMFKQVIIFAEYVTAEAGLACHNSEQWLIDAAVVKYNCASASIAEVFCL